MFCASINLADNQEQLGKIKKVYKDYFNMKKIFISMLLLSACKKEPIDADYWNSDRRTRVVIHSYRYDCNMNLQYLVHDTMSPDVDYRSYVGLIDTIPKVGCSNCDINGIPNFRKEIRYYEVYKP